MQNMGILVKVAALDVLFAWDQNIPEHMYVSRCPE